MIPLSFATKLAARIVTELSPFCKRIEIAGSIRRKRPHCGDIDLVIIAANDQRQALLDRIKRHAAVITGDSPAALNTISVLPMTGTEGIQIDCFFAHEASADFFDTIPSNFGSLLLCRTGSKEHNVRIASLAKSKGWHWHMYRGMLDGQGKIIASETEESIYAILGLPWLDPEQREV